MILDDFRLFLSSEMKDGIYKCKVQNGALDILLSGFSNSNNTVGFLVSFTAAVSNREKKTGPFFSGVGLSQDLGIPVLAISDPTVEMSSDCSLAWYAGNHNIPDLVDAINHLIVAVSSKYALMPLLIGGSGGGYASLVQASLLPIKAKVLVWNPQTDITKYIRKVLLEYLIIAYPEDFNTNLRVDSEKKLIRFLEKNIPHYSLNNEYISRNVEVLFLQNYSDWHLHTHTIPYFNGVIQRLSNSAFIQDSVILQIGNWGEGHVAPPKELIKNIILQVKNGGSLLESVFSADNEFFNESYFSLSYIDDLDISFNEKYVGTEKNIEVLINGNKPNSDVECAIYFLKGSERVKMNWYQKSNVFFCPEHYDAIQIFIRNPLKEIKHKYFVL